MQLKVKMLGCSSMFYCQGLTHCHWLSFFLPENEKKTKQNNSKVKRKISGSVKITPCLEKIVCFGWLWMLNISKLEGKDAIVSLTSVGYKTSQELWVLSSVTFFVRSLWLSEVSEIYLCSQNVTSCCDFNVSVNSMTYCQNLENSLKTVLKQIRIC